MTSATVMSLVSTASRKYTFYVRLYFFIKSLTHENPLFVLQADEAHLVAQEVPSGQNRMRIHGHLQRKPTYGVQSLQLDRMITGTSHSNLLVVRPFIL